MILKSSGCDGCPLQPHGEYFTPDTMVPGSTVLFIAQNPGADEELGHWKFSRDAYKQVKPQPLIGSTGQLFNRRFLREAGLKREEVSLANAIRCRPGSSLGLKADALPTLTSKMKLETSDSDIVKALKHCKEAYLKIPSSVKTIVTMGSYALFQQTGISNVTDWRGYALDYDGHSGFSAVDTSTYHDLSVSQEKRRLFITMHIAALYKGENKKYFHATLSDFSKLRRLLDGSWPKHLPRFKTDSPLKWPKYAAFDTEYYWDEVYRENNNKLIRWSLCDTDSNLYCVEAEDTPHDGIPIEKGSIVVIQNALADIAHLSTIVDMSSVLIEDMMLAHSVLWTGEPHSLNYIASIFGSLNRYKHLNIAGRQKVYTQFDANISTDWAEVEVNLQQLYSALDAYEPIYMWRNSFIPDFKTDPQSWDIYKRYRLPLIAIINKAQQTGVALDSSRLREVQAILQERVDSMKQRGRELVDDEFQIGGSKRVKEEIYK